MHLTAYAVGYILGSMPWVVDFHDDFLPEFDQLPEGVQDELLAHVELLEYRHLLEKADRRFDSHLTGSRETRRSPGKRPGERKARK